MKVVVSFLVVVGSLFGQYTLPPTNVSGLASTTTIQQNATRCLDANAAHDGSAGNEIICTTTPSFTPGSGTVVWVGFSAAISAAGFRVNVNGAGAQLTVDPCLGTQLSSGLYMGNATNGNTYYPLQWDDLNTKWVVPGPCKFAVGGQSNLSVVNTIPRTVASSVASANKILGLSSITDDGTTVATTLPFNTPNYQTTTNCSSSVSPAVCVAASAGSIAFPTGVTSVALTVNTTAVKANSQIFFMSDDTLGTKLGVTCNSTLATLVGGVAVTARTVGTSFQLTYSGTIATNPLCGSYFIVN